MNGSEGPDPIGDVASLVRSVRKKGVRLWSEDGRLHIKVPKGVLTTEESGRLKTLGRQIISFLEQASDAQAVGQPLELAAQLYAPLTFSQWAHWHLYQLNMRRSLRAVASATRLCGQLNIDAIRQGLQEVVRRHDALRTRIVAYDGVPTQTIAATGSAELEVDDLTAVIGNLREMEVRRRIEQLIVEPIDISASALLAVRLLKLQHDEYVLFVAMEHIIADAVSMTILLRDLFTIYMQVCRGQPISLPTIAVQFSDYAIWQRNTHETWLRNHGAYWAEHLRDCQRLRWPTDINGPVESLSGWGTVSLQIDSALRQRLSDCCRLLQTTVVLGVFAAFAAVVLRWCNAQAAVFQFEIDGRANPQIENSIGYFASPLFLRVELLESDRFMDLMKRVMDEYGRALQNADSSYIDSQVPRPAFTRNSAFNWVPQAPAGGLSVLHAAEHTVSCSAFPFENPMLKNYERDNEPVILLMDTEQGVAATLMFQRDRYSAQSMERFARNFLEFMKKLLTIPEGRIVEQFSQASTLGMLTLGAPSAPPRPADQ